MGKLQLEEHVCRRLLYLIAKWHIEEKCPFGEIAVKVENWLKKTVPTGDPANFHIDATTAGRYFGDAVALGFVQLARFTHDDLATRIAAEFSLGPDEVQIFVAPDRAAMLGYAWLDLDKLLRTLIGTEKRQQVVVGVSGGHTMLDFATAARSVAGLEWHQEIPRGDRRKAIICSLTSGGIRTDIAALSDTVAANIAGYLDADASGLLGPAWFTNKTALAAFQSESDVKKHIALVQQADIILTGIGCLQDPKNLMRQLLDAANASKLMAKYARLADMLYHCYNGLSGEEVPLPPKVANGLFSVIDLGQLSEKVKNGTRCFVLASGDEKSKAVPGILKRKMASHVYMDRACAEGILTLKMKPPSNVD